MAFVKVGKTGEVPDGTAKVYEVGDDICTHDDASLEQGYLSGYEIECPRHGACFDVRTGDVTALPAVVPIDTFPVRVEGDDIELDV